MARTAQPCRIEGIAGSLGQGWGVLVPGDPWVCVGVPWGPWGLWGPWGPWGSLGSLGVPGDSGGHGVPGGEGALWNLDTLSPCAPLHLPTV